MLKKYLLFIGMSFTAFITQSQIIGCTDMQSINYNPKANIPDGSCVYRETQMTPQMLLLLPKKLKEVSGIIYSNNKIYIHNDSGNPLEIYEINEEMDSIIHTTKIIGVDKDADWEDICADKNYIYISDAGNNKGNRTNLKILKIDLKSLSLDSASAEIINFRYPDQHSFAKSKHASNFDCETIFSYNDSLHIFTKNWLNYKTNHYSLPKIPGSYTATLMDSFDVDMLVTGADISEDQKEIVLCGYTKEGKANIILLWNFLPNHFFSGNKRTITLGTTTEMGQVEGVCFRDEKYIFISNENFMDVTQSLRGMDIGEKLNGLPTAGIDGEYIVDVNIYPNIQEHFVNAEIVCIKDFKADLYIINEKGKIIGVNEQLKFTNGYNQIKVIVEELPTGNYILICRNGNNNILRNKFVIH